MRRALLTLAALTVIAAALAGGLSTLIRQSYANTCQGDRP